VSVKVGLGQREGFADPQPGAPQHDDRSAQPDAFRPVAGRCVTAMISSSVGGSGGYRKPSFCGVRPAVSVLRRGDSIGLGKPRRCRYSARE
jgi:hypothetical protein